MTATSADVPALQDQMKVPLSLLTGYIGHRTVTMGMRAGLLGTLAETPEGVTADDLAERLGLDPLYVSVWCRSAFAAGICDRDGPRYRLAPRMEALLLDIGSPAYVGGVFLALEQPEMFGNFERRLASGERTWWDECGPEWIAAVARTGIPFYTRLIPAALERVPGLAERLRDGCTVVDTACGAGTGVVRLAQTYPAITVIGVDGDRHSVERAQERVAEAGLSDRVTLLHSPLEELRLDRRATVIVNNISMHECRDIDVATERVRAAIEPGGCFVISDFPFPDTDEGLRTPPGRVMCGIQFFEAQIDDQLLPRSVYDDLLARHGFTGIGSLSITPMHAVTYGFAQPSA